MNIRNELELQLNKPSHIVKVFDKKKGLRLTKNSKVLRYAYSKDDILEEFISFENFIKQLQIKGYLETTFLFQRIYTKNSTTYHTMKESVVNLEHQEPNMSVNNNNNQVSPVAPLPNFLGNPNTGAQSMQFLGAFVEAERSKDYKQRVSELEEKEKDYRSKIRRLEEENHSLKLKDATAEERGTLKLQKELLDKESVFESAGFQKVAEGLGGLLTHLPAFLNKGATPGQLGAPLENLSPLKSQVIEMLKTAKEDDVSFVAFVMQNMSNELVEVLQDYIQKQN